MAQMIGQQPFHGMTFDGKRYDCGSKQGYVEANLAMALAHPEMGGDIRVIAEKLLAQS
jgi:UTP--glucose-1-phosphate uridylyltransferase